MVVMRCWPSMSRSGATPSGESEPSCIVTMEPVKCVESSARRPVERTSSQSCTHWSSPHR